MRRRLRIIVVLVLGVVGLLGCRTFDVQTDWDPEIGFGQLSRFYFVEPPDREGENPFADNTLLRKRVRHAIVDVLGDRGYVAVANRVEADFLVTYDVLLEERLRVDGVSSAMGAGLYRRDTGIGSIFSTANVRAYQESTLIIDLLDPASEDLVWRGWGTGILRTRDRDRGRERLFDGVRAILERFPPDAPGA